MGRRDPRDHSKADIERHRKQIGQQEFKGRSKKNTLFAREKAQARKSSDGALQITLLYLAFIGVLLLGIYFMFYSMYAPPNKLSDKQ